RRQPLEHPTARRVGQRREQGLGVCHAARSRKTGGDPVIRYSRSRSITVTREPSPLGSIVIVTWDGSPSRWRHDHVIERPGSISSTVPIMSSSGTLTGPP